jgi:hypothetical protein
MTEPLVSNTFVPHLNSVKMPPRPLPTKSSPTSAVAVSITPSFPFSSKVMISPATAGEALLHLIDADSQPLNFMIAVDSVLPSLPLVLLDVHTTGKSAAPAGV